MNTSQTVVLFRQTSSSLVNSNVCVVKPLVKTVVVSDKPSKPMFSRQTFGQTHALLRQTLSQNSF